MATGRIHSEESFGTLDGPGVRYVVFMQGCPNRCIYCHNPDSWSNSGGRLSSAGELMQRIISCRNFIQKGGVTISGGEPLVQSAFTLNFLRALKENNIHTALDSCLFVPQKHLQPALAVTDIFLIDFKHPDSARHKELTGQNNELIKENLEFLAANGAKIAIRIPFVPGCNSALSELEETGKYLSRFCLEEVRLLPYHTLARSKYAALQLTDTMPEAAAPTPAELNAAVEILKQYGLPAISAFEA